MAKTLNQFLEGYLKVKNPDEQKFVDKHVTAKHPDRMGNGDEVFNGSKVKTIDRRKDRHGYNPGEDEKVYEALKGSQHKIDANKNGKVDARDFKLLRGKKKKVAEETEELDEISADMADRYLKGKRERDWKRSDDDSYSVPRRPQDTRRKNIDAKGTSLALKTIQRPRNRFAKEEVEQIDELSSDTLRRYRMKAKSIGDNEKGDIGYRSKGRELAGRKTHGGQYGIPKAKVMAKEEAELEEKINMDKASMGTVIKDFQKSDAPQFKGKSNDKRRAMAIAAKLTAERGGKPLNKEEKLANLLGDLTETHQRTMLAVFDKLNESNQKKFLEACETPEGVESMLDFSISHRGE
jgi:hypothetical protein